jgi:H/ACA ribonucleoprotein complex subunit 4
MTKLPFEKEREILVKKDAETSDEFGKYPWNRPINELMKYGVVNLNKPRGPTSHQVTAYLRDVLKAKKAGHSGTLDPRVTGVLPVAINRATRIVQYLLLSGKEYMTLMHIHKEVDEYTIRKVMNEFIGKIKQLPPIRSAVKRQLREREIYYLEILEIKGQDVLFKVGSQAGTYIRKLCHDIGEKLGVGAHMVELIRTKAGPFNLEDSFTLQDLSDAYYYSKQGKEEYFRDIVLPIENAVRHLPKIWVFDSTVDALCHGSYLANPGISKLHSNIEKGDYVAVMTLKNELIMVGKANLSSDEMLNSKKGIAVKPDSVFMDTGIYPKVVKKD